MAASEVVGFDCGNVAGLAEGAADGDLTLELAVVVRWFVWADAGRNIINDIAWSVAVVESLGVNEWFEGRAWLAWAEDDIYFAVDVVVGIIAGADHGEDFAGFGVDCEDGDIVGVEVFFVGCALGESGFFGDGLEFGVDGGVDF